jgi:hypothetical protein
MGLGGGWNDKPATKADISQARSIIDTVLSLDINVFDHADIYTFGKAETVFGEALKQAPELKDKMIIQSKCAIRFEDDLGPKRYDFSANHIHTSVEGILSRLGIEQLDILLLHRPWPMNRLRRQHLSLRGYPNFSSYLNRHRSANCIKKILQQVFSIRSQNRLRVELDAFYGVILMPKPHDQAVFCLCCDFQGVRHRLREDLIHRGPGAPSGRLMEGWGCMDC